MNRAKIHIACDVESDQEPLAELQSLLQSYAEGSVYVPSDPIPLGLYFMLNRGDRPVRKPGLVLAAGAWLRAGLERGAENAAEAYDLWCAEFSLHDRDTQPTLRFLERVLLLYGRLGVQGAREYYRECSSRYVQRVRERIASARKQRGGGAEG